MDATFGISTTGPGLYNFTHKLSNWISGDGILTLFVQHTSCSLVIQENADPQVLEDLQEYFHRLVPPADDPQMDFVKHTAEGPDDMPAHIKASMLPVCLTVPVMNSRMVLGKWQGIYLFEHRTEPRQRLVAAHIR